MSKGAPSDGLSQAEPEVSALRASIPSAGDLMVWWIPQVPMPQFEVPVPDLRTAVILLDALGRYDAFQYEHNVKPDYCNAGGLVEWEDGEWVDFFCPHTWADIGELRNDPDLLAQAIEARRAETGTGSVEDESAVGPADAPKSDLAHQRTPPIPQEPTK